MYKRQVIFYYQSVGTETQFRVASVTMEHPFKEVLVLDGFAMFVDVYKRQALFIFRFGSLFLSYTSPASGRNQA